MNMNVLKKYNSGQWGVFLIVIGIITLFFSTGVHHQLSLDAIKASQIRFHKIYELNPLKVISCFVALYIPMIALNLPGASVLGLLAGALFGTVTGTVLISFASSIGATLACLLARYLLRDWVQNRFKKRLEIVNQGIREEGAFYLFSLRLIPVIPFFLINIAMGLTPIRLRTFYWVSQLGMLPGTAVYVNAGSQIAQIDSLGDILSTRLIVSLALVGLLPLLSKKSLTFFRRRNNSSSAPSFDRGERLKDEMSQPSVREAIKTIQRGCTECGVCVTQCPFLQEYGNPKTILKALDTGGFKQLSPAFECSLCHLCSAVCPEHLEPGKLFHALRRQAMASGTVDLKPYRTILGYEKRGGSSLFSYYGLPRGCDTVFFPGCTLPGTRPGTTRQMFSFLRDRYPDLGIVLDCCTKPSHDLGRQKWFEHKFGEILQRLADSNIHNVLVACPNCYNIFKTYGRGLTVRTVYEELSSHDLPSGPIISDEIVVHDPCPLRREVDIQDAVRSILRRKGMTIAKMRHQGKRTVCCGEGGSTGFIRPDLARRWGEIRHNEADGRSVVTYCAGCAGFLNRTTPTLHLADLIFSPERVIEGDFKVSKSPLTYLNRLTLKRHFKRTIKAIPPFRL